MRGTRWGDGVHTVLCEALDGVHTVLCEALDGVHTVLCEALDGVHTVLCEALDGVQCCYLQMPTCSTIISRYGMVLVKYRNLFFSRMHLSVKMGARFVCC